MPVRPLLGRTGIPQSSFRSALYKCSRHDRSCGAAMTYGLLRTFLPTAGLIKLIVPSEAFGRTGLPFKKIVQAFAMHCTSHAFFSVQDYTIVALLGCSGFLGHPSTTPPCLGVRQFLTYMPVRGFCEDRHTTSAFSSKLHDRPPAKASRQFGTPLPVPEMACSFMLARSSTRVSLPCFLGATPCTPYHCFSFNEPGFPVCIVRVDHCTSLCASPTERHTRSERPSCSRFYQISQAAVGAGLPAVFFAVACLPRLRRHPLGWRSGNINNAFIRFPDSPVRGFWEDGATTSVFRPDCTIVPSGVALVGMYVPVGSLGRLYTSPGQGVQRFHAICFLHFPQGWTRPEGVSMPCALCVSPACSRLTSGNFRMPMCASP